MYGTPDYVTPLPRRGSIASDWEWPADKRSANPKPNFLKQHPEPAAIPPTGYMYPQAPIYVLNQEFDACYPRGYFLSAGYDSSKSAELRDHQLHITTPPNVIPNGFDRANNTWLRKPVPGMSKMH